MTNKFYFLPFLALTILVMPVKGQVPQTPDSSLFFFWNTNSQVFVPSYYEIYTYDPEGRVVEWVRKNSAGVSEYRIITTYNQAGKITRDEWENFDTVTGVFKKNFKIEIQYDHHTNPVSRRKYTIGLGGGSYQLEAIYDSTERIYDAGGRVMEVYTVSKDPFTDWERRKKMEFLYSGTDTVPHALYDYTYSEQDSAWVNTVRYEGLKWELGYDYSTALPPNVRVYSSLINGTWITHAYDSIVVTGMKKEAEFHFQWDGSSFLPVSRIRYTYDNMGSLFFFEYEEIYSNIWTMTNRSFKDSAVYNNKDQALFRYEMLYTSTGQWQYNRKRQNFFGAPVSVEQPFPGVVVSIYPNPACNAFSIDNREAGVMKADVFSASGQKLLEISLVTGTTTVDARKWERGVYFIHFTGSGSSFTQRVVIR